MASFTTEVTVTDPVRAIADMALAIERIVTTMEQANSNLMADVVGRLSDAKSPIHDAAYSAWCIHQIAIERLSEISIVLAEAESPLLDLAKRAEG